VNTAAPRRNARHLNGVPKGRASTPRLPPPPERSLVVAAQAGNGAARDELVGRFLPLIGSFAGMYRGARAVDRGELVQEGVVGLLQALDRFDSSLGTPFWAYASWWVRQAMQQLVSELGRPVVLSDRALRQLARVKDAQRRYVQAEGREPSLSALAAGAGLAMEQVERLVAVDRTARGLEERVGEEDQSGSLGDLLADAAAEEAFDRVDRRLDIEHLRGLGAALGDRELEVLRSHYGLRRPSQTLRQIGATLGLSAERVRQIEERALDKLRQAAGQSLPAG
jgi:RNA polymerase primary sigma factor